MNSKERLLAKGIRVGDQTLINETIALMSAQNAYTRGRAMELLAEASTKHFNDALSSAIENGKLQNQWWRTIFIRMNRKELLPEPLLNYLSEKIVWENQDSNSLFWAIHIAGFFPISACKALCLAALSHDDEVALLAIERLMDEKLIADIVPSILIRLQKTKGNKALLLRLKLEDQDAIKPSINALHEKNPFAIRMILAIEKMVFTTVPPALTLKYRGIRTKLIDPWIAAAAHKLGDPKAIIRLKRMANSRRTQLRVVALGQIARIGGPEEMKMIKKNIMSPFEPIAPDLIAELRHSKRPEIRDLLLVAAGRHPRAEARKEACHALAFFIEDPLVVTCLKQVASLDGDSSVQLAAKQTLY